MATVTGEIRIERPVDVVFETVADQRNEPTYNPALISADILTEGPVGVGTRFKAVHKSGRGTMKMTVELVEYDPPRRIASVTHASWAEISGAVTFEQAGDGATRMRWSWDVHTKGFATFFSPLIGVVGRRQERACWEGLKRYLEHPRPVCPGRRRWPDRAGPGCT